MDERKKIIIVEDDAVLRDVLAEKLENSGYSVEKAQDGIIAIEKIRANRPDCILLDILMPRMGGIEVLEKLHEDPDFCSIPVIIISNSGQPVEIKRAQELGAREFLIKAVFDPSEVLEKVKFVLSGGIAGVCDNNWVRTQNVIGSEYSMPPLREGLQEEAKIDTHKPVVDIASGSSTKVFVLVIEDDKFLRELLVRKLSGDGFDVQNAIDADAAFAILAERKPNVILLDLILPGVDGFEILARIKGDSKISNTPVIVLSNLGQKEDLEKAMMLGAKDFMVKANFTLDEIVAKVHGIVASTN